MIKTIVRYESGLRHYRTTATFEDLQEDGAIKLAPAYTAHSGDFSFLQTARITVPFEGDGVDDISISLNTEDGGGADVCVVTNEIPKNVEDNQIENLNVDQNLAIKITCGTGNLNNLTAGEVVFDTFLCVGGRSRIRRPHVD